MHQGNNGNQIWSLGKFGRKKKKSKGKQHTCKAEIRLDQIPVLTLSNIYLFIFFQHLFSFSHAKIKINLHAYFHFKTSATNPFIFLQSMHMQGC